MCLAQLQQRFDASEIAMVALFVAPLVSILVVRMQIRAQLVSANRQKWIEEFRSHVTQYVSEATDLSNSFLLGQPAVSKEAGDKMVHLNHLILLYLNTKLESHREMQNAIGRLGHCLHDLVTQEHEPFTSDRRSAVSKEIGKKTGDILDNAHRCLAEESEFVRRGQ